MTTAAPATTEAAKPTETKAPDATKPVEGKSLLNEEEPAAAAAAPDSYVDFKVPDGYIIDKTLLDEALPIFKESNLSQEAAQKLVDLYTKTQAAAVQKPYEAYLAERKAQADSVKDLYGTKLPEVKATIGRALNSLGLPAEVIGSFRNAMDHTGAGDFKGFVQVFEAMARRITEGRPVTGSPAPVADPNRVRPTPAQAMYPNLPASAVQ